MKRPLKFPLKFEKGIRLITRKQTATKAEKAFNSYYSWLLENIYEHARPELEKEIESARKAGWSDYSIRLHRRKYVQMPRRKPRKKVKKEFDAKGLPKVGKTPLDPRTAEFLGALKDVIAHEKWTSDALKVDKSS
jgi:hypothetical protein